MWIKKWQELLPLHLSISISPSLNILLISWYLSLDLSLLISLLPCLSLKLDKKLTDIQNVNKWQESLPLCPSQYLDLSLSLSISLFLS